MSYRRSLYERVQGRDDTTLVIPNGVRIVFWPPNGDTRMLATGCLNGSTAVGMYSPYAAILGHILPTPSLRVPTGDEYPGTDNLYAMLQQVRDLYEMNRPMFPEAQGFVVVAAQQGEVALEQHLRAAEALFRRLGVSAWGEPYEVVPSGVLDLTSPPHTLIMGSATWAVPCGVLGAIVVIGTLFFFWWFPRTFKRGVKVDNERLEVLEGDDREARRRENRETIERFKRARAVERGEVVELNEQQVPPPPVYLAPPEYK
ncbi:unnamed protein product [Zymoseptoria tritici ST99CH_1E4]|uniref:Uncharacterized protein n=1 Tax=Zymoseptoria tritici ST99CH_1E4 TaxID=1276532 RepID=A0A2H1GAB0_ZYMTR|nr:unnamed protein product [Zymoseptoria tritici ST99CH_1E4]